jgi:cytoskeletal protein CcmA (bactofilin family)
MVKFKRKDGDSNDFDTLVGESTNFEGNIQSEKTIRIDGRVDGDIKAGENVFVGSSAIIKGNITAKDVYVAGHVEGNVISNGVLKLTSTAKLYGDIQIYSFVADEGGIFQGKCNMLEVSDTEDNSGNFDTKKISSDDFKKSTLISTIYEDRKKNKLAMNK